LVAHSVLRGHIDWQQAGGTSIQANELVANVAWEYPGTGTNPFAGQSVGKAAVSSGDSSGTSVLTLSALLNNVA
jgi:hypothetical protein